jgi:hypothetical protein
MISQGGKHYGIEFKLATIRSMHAAIETLGLEKLLTVYPGSMTYPRSEKILALPLCEALTHL